MKKEVIYHRFFKRERGQSLYNCMYNKELKGSGPYVYSDQYFSASFRAQQTITFPSPGTRRIETKTWTHYQTQPQMPSTPSWRSGSQFRYNYPSSWDSPYNRPGFNQFKMPEMPKMPQNYGPRPNWP